MNSLAILFSLILSVSAETKAPALNSQQLDQFIIQTCSLQSNEKSCLEKMTTIKKGLTTEELLKQAPALKIDSSIQTTIINDPSHFTSQYYCLAIYNGVVSEAQVPADIFPYVVYGFSFNTKSLGTYKKWLNSKAARPCVESLKILGLTPTPLTGEKEFNIILNPITFLENGTEEAFLDTAIRNYNHERLHAIYAFKSAKTKVAKLWKSLTKGEQEQFKSEHLHYNFNNKDILYREFFSFTFESAPEEAYTFLSNTINYSQVKKATCKSCLADDDDFKAKIQALSQLSPKDLLAKLEEEKIKVLILSSGRKNPSKLFYWGQIREDKGHLTQISAIEGAMGKTLCQGEKPESLDATTIVLASDSPYSTLIHEYIHVMQIKKDVSWCPVSKRLWTEKPAATEIRMVRDREWDARLVLWNLLTGPQMNVEDQIIVAEGILRESEGRKNFDPNAARFISDNKIQLYLQQKIEEYKKAILK
ncbi:hypothetical protein SHI21_08385 [Bacteriovorax sp. PP10]|uniref:Uncharacterized protein n=1 Tax=Bacteriovorax antarcticus TaxID=3088717 RepID=A0ABU5VT35_9BACT|nr:hypothetical protein [Bacteriovorax sp. PP10]MEA9356216.1 hypothetical protein [Bacteriovorax sp. PP10]